MNEKRDIYIIVEKKHPSPFLLILFLYFFSICTNLILNLPKKFADIICGFFLKHFLHFLTFLKFIPSKNITQSSLIFDMDSSIGGQSYPLKILWRCSLKGNFTLAHIYALIQLKIFCDKRFQCTILISDLDAFLDKLKCPWQDLKVFFEIFLKIQIIL